MLIYLKKWYCVIDNPCINTVIPASTCGSVFLFKHTKYIVWVYYEHELKMPKSSDSGRQVSLSWGYLALLDT